MPSSHFQPQVTNESASFHYSFASSRISCKFSHVVHDPLHLSLWDLSGLSTPVACWVGFCRGAFHCVLTSPQSMGIWVVSRASLLGTDLLGTSVYESGVGCVNTFSLGKYLLSRIAGSYGNCSVGLDKNLLYSTGDSTQYSVMTYVRKESKKRVDICICITGSLCCTPQTNTTL